MPTQPFRFVTLGAFALLSVAALADAPRNYFLPRDTVVPIQMENEITLRHAHIGDRFTAHVETDSDLPRYTRLIGRIDRIRQDSGDKTVVDLSFTDVILPDGSRHYIYAVPIPMSDRYTRREADGRIVLRQDPNRDAGYVLGGALGGFVVGSIIHRQGESTIIGAFLGAIASKVDRHNDGNTVVQKGQHLGMLVERDTHIDAYAGRPNRPYDDRDDRYDNRDPRSNNPIYGRPDSGRPLPPVDDRRPNDSRDDRRDDPRDDRSSDNRLPVIRYEDREIHFTGDNQPYREGDTLMVPMEQMVKELGLTMEKGRSNAIYIEGENDSLRLEQGSSEGRLNGRTVELKSAVVEKNGVLYMPIEVLASMKKGNLNVDGTRLPSKAD